MGYLYALPESRDGNDSAVRAKNTCGNVVVGLFGGSFAAFRI
jgi:hypothetical protein